MECHRRVCTLYLISALLSCKEEYYPFFLLIALWHMGGIIEESTLFPTHVLYFIWTCLLIAYCWGHNILSFQMKLVACCTTIHMFCKPKKKNKQFTFSTPTMLVRLHQVFSRKRFCLLQKTCFKFSSPNLFKVRCIHPYWKMRYIFL